MATAKTQELFEHYHRFDDGLLLSFEYFYAPNEALAVQLIFFARNHALPGDVWRKVGVKVRDVQEVFVDIKGEQFNAISSGVKLLQFDQVWCLDVDGTYSMGEDPRTLEEVREGGTCYVVGREVEAFELSA